jgi:hypothetical protein
VVGYFKINIQKIEWEVVDWIRVFEDRAVGSYEHVMNIRAP